jgi:hypothetical protein
MTEFVFSRAVQPMHWAGMTKVAGGPMVCGACSTPEACDTADRCARASDEDYLYAFWSIEEMRAVEHVKERIREDGDHDVNGCPRYCRAMCSHRRVIIEMVAAKKWPTDLKGI